MDLEQEFRAKFNRLAAHRIKPLMDMLTEPSRYSNATIARKLSMGVPTVDRAEDWLASHGATIGKPHNKREYNRIPKNPMNFKPSDLLPVEDLSQIKVGW